MVATIAWDAINGLCTLYSIRSNRLWTYETSPGPRKDQHPDSSAKRKLCAEKGGDMVDTLTDTMDLAARDQASPSSGDTSKPDLVERHLVSDVAQRFIKHSSGRIRLQASRRLSLIRNPRSNWTSDSKFRAYISWALNEEQDPKKATLNRKADTQCGWI